MPGGDGRSRRRTQQELISPRPSGSAQRADGSGYGADPERLFDAQLARAIAERIYVFRAERPVRGTAPAGNSAVLAPDAANLAEVLGVLRANPHRFARLTAALRRVFGLLGPLTVTSLLSLLAIAAGIVLLVLPGLYLMLAFMLVWQVVVVELWRHIVVCSGFNR